MRFGYPPADWKSWTSRLSEHGWRWWPQIICRWWPTWHRVIGNDAAQGAAIVQYLKTTANAKKVFVVDDGQDYSKGLADVVKKGLGSLVGGTDIVQPGQTDFSATVTAVKGSGADSLFYGGYSPQAGPIRKQLTTAGLDNVTMVGGDGIKDDAFLSLAGTSGEGTVAGCGCADVNGSTDPAAQAFVKEFTDTYNAPPGIYAAEGWDISQIYIAALKAGKTSRDDITSFIAGPLYGRLGPKITITAGAVGLTVGPFLLSMADAGSSYSSLIAGFALTGLGAGLFYP